MLISGVLKFDPEGRIIASSDPPVDFNGGTPIAADGGLAAAGGAAAEIYFAAIGYLNDGTLTDSTSPLLGPGPITNSDGQIRISNALPAFYYAGLPITADGRLAISPGSGPPVDPGEFDFGFDNSFDIGV
jgi:hypothetical protein